MAVRRLMALGGALLVLVLVGSGAMVAAGHHALGDMARKDRAVVRGVVARTLQRAISELTTVTVWDQAYRELRPGGSPTWADDEVGSFLARNHNSDRTVAVDGRDAAFYAWVGKARGDAAAQGEFLAAAEPVIQRARALERARTGSARLAATELSETASGIVTFDGYPYIVAASTVTPESATAARAAGPAVLVVTSHRLEPTLLTLLRQTLVEGGRIAQGPPPAPSSIELRDAAGRPLGHVVWTPARPALAVLRQAAPALVLAGLLIAMLLGALGLQIWRVARRLYMHERAHDAAMRDLEEARDRAEAANVAKSQFLANMSHEIRTPLNGVLGMAQVLAKSDLAPADREKVQVIRGSGETLLSLLNDLLDLSKIEAGRMEIDVQDFDLEEAVDAATRGFSTLAAQKDVLFLVDIHPAAVGVWRGDGGRIRQVLANLTSNAVKFTCAGEVRIAVRRTAEGLACTVADSGAGIARDRLAHLFQRFSQVDPSATRKYGGTGLGLAISRELVELMGGEVAVTSVEDRGSAFTFTLPLEWVGPPAPAEAAAEADLALPNLRILAAEDNRTNQMLLTAILDPLGVELRMAADGREALAAFATERFDLVLMDIQMPTMNGVDAVLAIRALEAERGQAATPILALSANVMPHQLEEYLAAGMNGFVAKPIELPVLIAAIEQALAERPDARSAVA